MGSSVNQINGLSRSSRNSSGVVGSEPTPTAKWQAAGNVGKRCPDVPRLLLPAVLVHVVPDVVSMLYRHYPGRECPNPGAVFDMEGCSTWRVQKKPMLTARDNPSYGSHRGSRESHALLGRRRGSKFLRDPRISVHGVVDIPSVINLAGHRQTSEDATARPRWQPIPK